ncbi:tape measure protein [Streptococcus sp. 116-D4]|uniref:tape measure protein n=1 Tax=Streptococcus sp. 116-D4 TaxID=2598453 RepID=UPI0012B4774A|nr:tape measure protein [Streptococcus sp. 116-D4]BBP09825.1 membrane protein [Streptococcus sp. 116-D4]
MTTLMQTLALRDNFSSPLNRINSTINRTIAKFGELDRRVKKMTQTATIKVKADMPKNFTAPKAASPVASKMATPIAPKLPSTGPLVGGLGVATSMLGRMTSISRALNFMVAIQALRQMANLMSGLIKSGDDYIQTMARLKTIEDGSKTGQELQDSIMAAAQRSRTGFGIMADSVAKLRSQAGEAFKSNDEAIAFAEQLNKLYKIGGASLEQQKAGTLQITQALASGVLRGDEFNSMMENAPLVAQKLARHLGVSVGQLRAMAKDGQLTGDTLKNALLGSAVETNAEFAKMPMTFADMMTQIGNVASYAFQPLIQAWQEFINSTAGQNFMAGLETAMFAIGQIALWLFNLFVAGWNWVTENINFVITALEMLAAVVTAVAIAMAIAWMVANWPLVLMISIILAIASILDALGVSFIEVAAIIVAAFVFVGTVVYDIIMFVINLVVYMIAPIVNLFIGIYNIGLAVAEFLRNVFKHPVYSIRKLFYNLVRTVLDYFATFVDGVVNVAQSIGNAFIAGANIAIKAINWIIDALNTLGLGLGNVGEMGYMSNDGSFANGIRAMGEMFNPGEAPDDYESFDGMRANMITPGDLWDGMKNPFSTAGNAFSGTKAFGQGIGDAMQGFADKMKAQDELASKFDQMNQTPAGAGAPEGGGGGGKGLGDKLGKGKNIGNVGKIEDEVKLKDEDIKMMRDVAERKYIIDYQVLTPQVSVKYESKNSATEQDIDDLVDRIEEKIVGLVDSDLGIA